MGRERNVMRTVSTVVLIVIVATISIMLRGPGRARADANLQVTGTVSDSQSNGVTNVSVYATDPGTSTVEYGPITTNSDGTYNLPVAPGIYDIYYNYSPPPPYWNVPGPSYDEAVEHSVSVTSDQTINVNMQPDGYSIGGDLTFNGQPAAYSPGYNGPPQLHFTPDQGNLYPNQQSYASAAPSDGSYSTKQQLPNGSYNVGFDYSAASPGNSAANGTPDNVHLVGTTPVVVNGSNVVQNLALTVNKLKVVVKNQTGNPVSGVSLNITAVSGTTTTTDGTQTFQLNTGGVSSSGTTGSDGSSTASVLNGMTYSVCTSGLYDGGGNPYCVPSNPTVTADGTVEIDVPGVTVSGQVTVDGQPQTNASVQFMGPTGSANNGGGYASTNANGYYSVSLPSNSFTAYLYLNDQEPDAVKADLSSVSPSVVVGTSDMTQDFAFDTDGVAVTVKDANGNPVSGISTTVMTTSGTVTTLDGSQTLNASSTPTNFATLMDSIYKTGTTDNNGTVTLPVIPGPTYSACVLVAVSDTRYCASQDVTVTGNTAIEVDIPITVAPAAPTNLTAPTSTSAAPALSWDAIAGVTYNIYRDGTLLDSSNTNSYVDTSATSGSHTYYVTAVNSSGESKPSNTATVDYEPTTPPTITSPSSLQINARDQTNFTVTTTGNPTPTLTESGALPAGLTFTDNGDGTAAIAGQASTTNQGYYFLTITATSSAGSTSQSFTLSVNNAQEAPAFVSPSSDTESYGVPFSFTVGTTGDPIPTISKLSGSGSLPAGVTLHDNGDGTATISGELAKASDSGSYSFTLQAKNKNGSANQPFTLTITKTPVIKNIATKTATVGTSFSQSISASGDPTPSLTVSGLPAGLTFTDNGDGAGTISGAPAVGSDGTYHVTITASSTQGSSSSSFTLKVKG